MSEPKFKENERVGFMAHTIEVENGIALDVLKNFVGYVKQIRRGLFKNRYAICVAKTSEMFIVDERDVFGLVEKKGLQTD